jgi:ribosomal protein S18 acetylase RimI-like enzyme
MRSGTQSPFRAGAISVHRLGPADLPETFAFLDRDPVTNVYLLALLLRDALAQPRDEFWAARREGAIVGLLHLGALSGAVLPLGEDEEALLALGDQARERCAFLPRRFQLIGPRVALSPFLRRFARSGAGARLDRDQVYMVLAPAALPPFERLPELVPARPADMPLIYDSGARLRAEELEEDPRSVDALGYQRRVEEECRDGHTFLWKHAGGMRFRASVSALTADAAQISGVYTPPELRNRGFATRGLSELCARLFERSRAVCLFVNQINAPALAVYRRVGFEPRSSWRSLFYDTAR